MRMILYDAKINTVMSVGLFASAMKSAFQFSAILPYNDLTDNILTVIICLSFVVEILRQPLTPKILFIYGSMGLFAVFSAMQSGEMVLVFTTLTCFALRGRDFDKYLRKIFVWSLFFLILHTILSIITFFLFGTQMVVDGTGNSGTALCFGFSHRNGLAIYIFNLLMMWCWLNFDRLKNRHLLGIFVTATVVYLFIQSRTSYLTTIAACLLLFCLIHFQKLHKLIRWGAMVVVPGLGILTITMILLFLQGNPVMEALDDLLTGRINLGAYGLVFWGLTALGQFHPSGRVPWSDAWGFSTHTYDNIYSYMLMHIGWVWLIVASVGFCLLARKNDRRLHFMTIIWAVYGMAEVHGVNGFYLFPVLLFSQLLPVEAANFQGECYDENQHNCTSL